MRSRTVKEFSYKLKIKVRSILRSVWPIQWHNFYDFATLWKSVRYSDYFSRLSLVVFSVGALISIFLFLTSLYTVSSYTVAAKGGYFQEGLLGVNRLEIKTFNPLLTPNSDNEKRVTSLLYHPLYEVELPNFASEDTSIKISPVLLQKAPEWADKDSGDAANRFKRLRMVLKDDLQWSDKSKITLEDVQATFEKLKEKDANAEFNLSFQDVNFEIIAGQPNTFDLVANKPSPMLIYSANFSPVPKDLFFNQSIDQIQSDNYSKAPTKTSGYYTFATGQSGTIQDPRNPDAEKKPNPFIDPKTGVLQTIILKRNQHQNYTDHDPYIEYYIFERFPNFLSNPNSDPQASSSGSSSLEDSFKANQTQFFSRSTLNTLDANLTSSKVQATLNSQQKVVGSNTYYMLFYKAQTRTFLVNKFLRKYISCNIQNADLYNLLDPEAKDSLLPVPKSKLFVPPQLQTAKDVDCGGNLNEILTANNKVYNVKEPEAKDGLKRVNFGNGQISLTLLYSGADRKIATALQSVMKNAGFRIDIYDKDQAPKLTDTTAVMYLYSVTTASPDIYNLYSRKAQNIVAASANNELTGLEDLLVDYQTSLGSAESRAKLTDFFAENSLSLTLFQGKHEFNYSSRVMGIKDSLPNFNSFPFDFYYKMNNWYVNQDRKSKIFDR
ncbi:MAG: hypothetical protein OHK0017_02330 [Patescibacteria group bacterium]